LIRNYCIGLDLWGLYANGAGGTYTELIKIDSFDCGFTYPPAGTALVSFCAGTTRVSHIADGNGNYTKRIDGYDSSLCTDSYGTRPITTTVTPTKLTGTGKDGTVKLNVTGNVFTGLNRANINKFVVITDNETYAGRMQPVEALARYRKQHVNDAKLIVCGTSVTNFTIADPKDPGMMDIVGFDSAAQQLIQTF
jgi:hypothetical protein